MNGLVEVMSNQRECVVVQRKGEVMDTNESFLENQVEREKKADRLADEVRALRVRLDEVQPGPARKTQRQRILLQIETKQWVMGRLNPKKYGVKPKKSDRLDIFTMGRNL